MPTGTIILLGAFAGLTIYLGLPLAFVKKASQSIITFASMFATGILIFLLYDMIGKASEPIVKVLDQVNSQHIGIATLFVDLFLLAFGLALGLVGLVYFNKYIFTTSIVMRFTSSASASTGDVSPVIPSLQPALASVDAPEPATVEMPDVVESASPTTSAVATVPSRELAPGAIALIIAIGIGLHNFSEGLAIGQSAAIGALQLVTILIIGFGLHNMTEGFGIAGPLTGQYVSWKFILLLGLVGGGPTFLGTVVGIIFQSPQMFIFCLALAAGAIIYVVAELLGVARHFKSQEIAMWGLLVGFLLGYTTDLIVTFAGA